MARPALEVADILRDYGPAWRDANRGHVSLAQMKVMTAIVRCRTAALGGHVAACENEACRHTLIAYNSCRDLRYLSRYTHRVAISNRRLVSADDGGVAFR